jgi:hypothetical protein
VAEENSAEKIARLEREVETLKKRERTAHLCLDRRYQAFTLVTAGLQVQCFKMWSSVALPHS